MKTDQSIASGLFTRELKISFKVQTVAETTKEQSKEA